MDNVNEIAKRFGALSDGEKLSLLNEVNDLSELRMLSLIATINGGCKDDKHRFSKWVPINLQRDDFACSRTVDACICLDCGTTNSK